ncbi:type VI secretion system Vgr family protein [Massilia brevitalea]|uniref:type VI secretion system Vgr family protein n=1 Tax=Massilia brevitalea TaxID=442526 RepID=UPI002738863C|nr:type VI secretion system Vgr family protein [Massilia brevitalea]
MNAASELAALAAALDGFGTGLSQHARLITLASAQDSSQLDAPAVEAFRGREAVNELFAFEVDALSTSTDLDLSIFIGEELTVGLLQPDGSRRAWHGLCTGAAWLGADGGIARYRLQLEPALSLLTLRRDSWLFQDKNAREIVSELLADYPQVRFEFAITQELRPRPVCTQYRETDFEFLVRLLASEGLNWRFEHDQADDAPDAQGHARHKLVIFDSRARIPATPGGAVLRFHGVRATEHDDAIDDFHAHRSVQANGVAISSWDPTQLVAPSAEQQSCLDAGALPVLQIYDGSGERIATERGAPFAHSDLMLLALEQGNKVFEGGGAMRWLAAGYGFQLTQHDRYSKGENAFTVLWVEHAARNNFRTGIADSAPDGLENGTYRNRFGCVRDAVRLVPRATSAPYPSTALGPQTALVVGVADATVTSTRDHQVRVQFAWQRGQGANRGGLEHDTDKRGCAPGDQRSGTWVRVSEALAGPNWGTVFTPRIGTEVLVDFIEGDMDRPIIVAQLFTGADLPPFSAGVDSGVDHAGVLSGIHTHGFDGSGYNQWQIDDTQGQLRTRLATSCASTQLNLGYLIQQSPGSAARGAYRGSGFELRTDAWAVIRGGEGVLVSTSARPQQGSGITSTQMDAAESVSLFKGAQALATTLGDAAAQQRALFSKDALKAQADFIEQIDPAAQGKYAGAVGGQDALKARPDSRELDAGQPVEKFGSALVLMDAAASMNWATPASTVIYAGHQLQWTTQSDLHLAAAHTVSSVAGGAASLFTHSGGIQAIAGNGPVSLQAHTDQLEILADKEITVISVNDCIEIRAKEKIVLQAGQSAVTLEGGDITFACPGKFTVKGGKHLFDGGGNKAANLLNLPGELSEEAKHWIGLHYLDPELAEGIPEVDYKIHFEGGSVLSGTLDKDGKALHENVLNETVKKVVYSPREPKKEEPHDPLEKLAS